MLHRIRSYFIGSYSLIFSLCGRIVTYFWYYNNGDVNMVFKVQIYRHSFVKRLKTFISDSVDLSFSLNLPAYTFLVQCTGFPEARVQHLREQ